LWVELGISHAKTIAVVSITMPNIMPILLPKFSAARKKTSDFSEVYSAFEKLSEDNP